MIFSLESILHLHDEAVKGYGGLLGIRDNDLLDSAINRVSQTFDGKELYPTAFHKAAAIFESVILNHPFLDGNKRTGFLLAVQLLREYNFELNNTEDEQYDFIISVSQGSIDFGAIVSWLQQNSQPLLS